MFHRWRKRGRRCSRCCHPRCSGTAMGRDGELGVKTSVSAQSSIIKWTGRDWCARSSSGRRGAHMHSERLSSMQQLPMAMLMQLVIIADLVLLLWPWNQLHSPPESSRNALLQLQNANGWRLRLEGIDVYLMRPPHSGRLATYRPQASTADQL